MRALLLQYIQTRLCESRVRFPRPVRRLCQTSAKRKNLSARVISPDRSQAGRRGRREYSVSSLPLAPSLSPSLFLLIRFYPDARVYRSTTSSRTTRRRSRCETPSSQAEICDCPLRARNLSALSSNTFERKRTRIDTSLVSRLHSSRS
jgi:hypothetical protein